ncbi:unnamed protein product [Trichobilharzia regenti]|nr:unnamed protein product [Trichobilharzia regenti]
MKIILRVGHQVGKLVVYSGIVLSQKLNSHRVVLAVLKWEEEEKRNEASNSEHPVTRYYLFFLPFDLETILDNLKSNELDEKFDLLEDGEVDEEEARFLEEYRRKRIAMLKEEACKPRFGCVREVTKADWTTEVTNAGDDIFVIVHISEKG